MTILVNCILTARGTEFLILSDQRVEVDGDMLFAESDRDVHKVLALPDEPFCQLKTAVDTDFILPTERSGNGEVYRLSDR